MNCNQNIIRPDVNPPANGNQSDQPNLGKLRRKLRLTFVLSNPFKVPVAQSPTPSVAPETGSAPITVNNPIYGGDGPPGHLPVRPAERHPYQTTSRPP